MSFERFIIQHKIMNACLDDRLSLDYSHVITERLGLE